MNEWSSRTNKADLLFAVLAPLLLLLSILPLASVGAAESSFLAAALWLVAFAFCVPDALRSASPRARPAWFFRFLVFLLLAWCLFQFVPIPDSWPVAPFLRWRGSADVLSKVAAHARTALPIAIDPHLSAVTLLLWAGLFFFAAAASRRLFRAKPRYTFLFLFVVAASIEAACGVFLHSDADTRIHGHFANADAFGGLLVMSIAVTSGLILAFLTLPRQRGSDTFRWWFAKLSTDISLWSCPLLLALLALQWVALYASGSRGAAIAALLASLILFGYAARSSRPIRRLLLVAIPLILAAAVLFHVNAIRQNAAARSSATSSQDPATRFSFWKATARLVADFPAGTGPGGTTVFLSHYQDPDLHGRIHLDYAHNDSLQFLADLGLPGFAILSLLLLLLAIRAHRACRHAPQNDDHVTEARSPWVLRGVAVALFAALLHAQLEFNLSARPPVQIAFLCLAAVLFSAGRPARDAHLSSPPRLWFPSVILLAILSLAAAAASLAAALSYRSARSVALASGDAEVTDSSLLLPSPVPLSVSDPDGSPLFLRVLDLARRLDPFSPMVPWTAAKARIAAQTDLVEREAAARAPDGEEPDDATLNTVASLFRFEEAAALRLARRDADDAVALAPWSPFILADRAWIVLRGISIGAFPASDMERAIDDIHLATSLFPSESALLNTVADALLFTAGDSPDALERIFSLGARILELNPALTQNVLELWWNVNIPIGRILALPHLPPDCLWRIYDLAEKEDPDRCRDILHRISLSLDDPLLFPPPSPDSPWLPAPPPAASPAALARHRNRVVASLLLLDARDGNLLAITDSSRFRADARLAIASALFDNPDDSPLVQSLRLRRAFDENRLPEARRIDCAISLLHDSRNAAAIRTLVDAYSLESLSAENLARVRELPIDVPFPDARPAVAPVPENSLDIPFLGESVVLDSISVLSNRPLRVAASFRFRSSELPPHLSFAVTLCDAAGHPLEKCTYSFESNCPSFRRGSPDFDPPCSALLSFRRFAPDDASLSIALFGGKALHIYPDDVHRDLSFPLSAFLAPAAPAPDNPDISAPEKPAPGKSGNRQKRRHVRQHNPSAKASPQDAPVETPPPAPETAPADTPEPEAAPVEPPPMDPDLAAALVGIEEDSPISLELDQEVQRAVEGAAERSAILSQPPQTLEQDISIGDSPVLPLSAPPPPPQKFFPLRYENR